MIRALLAIAALTLAAPLAAQDEPVTAAIIEHSDGSRSLVHEAVIDAPVERVWATLSTAQGWKMWGPQEAWFDFRIGGTIETSYVAGSGQGSDQNIIHRILGFVPERLIILQLEQAPAGGFDSSVFDGTWGVYELEPFGEDRTRLRITGAGYGDDEGSTQMLEFFKSGNVYSIEQLKAALEVALRYAAMQVLG